MDNNFRNYKEFTCTYIDDVLVFSKTGKILVASKKSSLLIWKIWLNYFKVKNENL